MNNHIKNVLKTLIPAAAITAFVLVAIPVSCGQSTEGLSILQGDFNSPVLKQVVIKSSSSIELSFDKKITVVNPVVYTEDEKNGTTDMTGIGAQTEYSTDSCTALLTLETETECGGKYYLEGTVEDENRNTLDFSLTFTGYNSRVPVLALNEVRNSYTSSTTTSGKKYKCEYIEIIALSDGNLAGVQVMNASEGEEKQYVFPSVEVVKGQYITLHLRSMEEGCIDETLGDLTLSTATDSCSTALDFWQEGTKARLGATDIITLTDSSTGKILDALLYSTEKSTEWTADQKTMADRICEEGIWSQNGTITSDFSSAFDATNISSSATTRTMSRQRIETPGSPDQWIVTCNKGSGTSKQSGDTPGYENSTCEFTK